MRRFIALKITAAVMAAALPMTAQAAVTYAFAFNPGESSQGAFSVTLANPITTDTVVPSASLTSCFTGYADTSCADQEFVIQSGRTRVGFATLQLFEGDLYGFTSYAYFGLDAFTTNGIHSDAFGEATLTVSGITATAPVPEPASWALMIGGLGLAGAALRGRRAVRFATA